MPRVMTLSDGRNETILNAWDFENLVDEYMGLDARNYLHGLLNKLANFEDAKEAADSVLEKSGELFESLEKLQEKYEALERRYEI